MVGALGAVYTGPGLDTAVPEGPPVITSHSPGSVADLAANQGCGLVHTRRFYCSHCGEPLDVWVSCGERACPDCRRQAFRRLWAIYVPLIRQVPKERLALVTLTLRIAEGQETLEQRLDRIRALWRRLIRQKVWRPVVGGLYAIEAVWSSRFRGSWNVHIHALVEARRDVAVYRVLVRGQRVRKCAIPGEPGEPALTWQRLRDAWRALTRDSFVVDITPVDSHKQAFRYVIKYLVKPAALPSWEARQAYNRALRGRRLVQSFGVWHETHKAYRFVRPEEKRESRCPVCGASGQGLWISEFALRMMCSDAVHNRAGPGPPVNWRGWLDSALAAA